MKRFVNSTRGFLRRLVTPWLRVPNLAALPLVQPWTRVDMDKWLVFMQSDTGKKLVSRLRATESKVAIAGSKDVMHTVHSAGCSKGYSDCVEHLLSLGSTCQSEQVKIEVREKTEEEEALELLTQA